MAEEEAKTDEQQPQQVPPQEPIYATVSETPLLDAIDGIRFDFNDGLRIAFPEQGGSWRLVFKDMDTGTVLHSAVVEPGQMLCSIKKYYIRFQLEIYHGEEQQPAFVHSYDAANKLVMIQLPVPTIGDTLGWFPYVEKFRVKHNCHVVAVLNQKFIPILEKQYPEIEFITKDRVPEYKPYACYYLGLFFKGELDHQPCDFRFVGLHRTAGYILGVDPEEERPRFDLSAPRKIQEPYVCIASQASSQAKYWNNPVGWLQVVDFLKQNGYRVLCVDRDIAYGMNLAVNSIPYGSENFTGALPLQERIDLIKDADFFIGLPSGLSWIAWGCGVPVVLISGFSHPTTEFYTPYRVINYNVCNSCWNDMREDFDHFDFMWCPRHKGTDRHFECTRCISTEHVVETLKKIPAFQKHCNTLK